MDKVQKFRKLIRELINKEYDDLDNIDSKSPINNIKTFINSASWSMESRIKTIHSIEIYEHILSNAPKNLNDETVNYDEFIKNINDWMLREIVSEKKLFNGSNMMNNMINLWKLEVIKNIYSKFPMVVFNAERE